MEEVRVEQDGFLCPSCAGQCVYDPGHQGLTCESCGAHHQIETDPEADADAEYPFDPEQPAQEAALDYGARAYACRTCGGEIVFSGPALSERCPYCDGPVVLGASDTGFETTAVIPGRVTQDDAQGFAQKWVQNRLAAPGDLPWVVSKDRVAGIYAPFWTFDSREAVQYWASYTVGSGKRRRRKHVSGRMNITFDDLLVPASDHVTPLIRDGILHAFDPARLEPYDGRFLAGLAAERHHQTVAEGLKSNRADKDLLIRNRIKRHVGRASTKVTRYRTDTSGIHYRRILLPVWILHYSYRGRAQKVVVSGIDGRTYGERPFSLAKLAGYAAGVAAMTIAFGMVWGALAAM